MRIRNAIRALARCGLAVTAVIATPLFAGTIVITGPVTSNPDGSNSCFYTAFAESSGGNWTFTCAASGTRKVTFTQPIAYSNCTTYTGIQQSIAGDVTVTGCVSAANNPPVFGANAGAYSVSVGETVTLGVVANDPDSPSLTARFYNAATNALIGSTSTPTNGAYSITFNAISEGVTSIRVEVTDGFNTVLTTQSVVAMQRPAATQVLSDSKATSAIGVIAASQAVSDLGAFVYSIPIPVPPGPNGMQPALSFNYNSQAGNSFLAMGWSLGGISSITRCPATQASNGKKDSINYDKDATNDYYCLDGQRLMQISRVVTSNDANCLNLPRWKTEYRTEIESYSRIVAYEDDPCIVAGPTRFEVFTKSGLWMMFGRFLDPNHFGDSDGGTWVLSWPNQTEDSNRGNTVKAWPLVRSMDRAGNVIRYTYCGTNLLPGEPCEKNNLNAFPFMRALTLPPSAFPPTEHHIKAIFYGAHADRVSRVVDAGSEATGQMYFGYGVRGPSDQHRWFDSGGGETTLTWYLHSITTGARDGSTWIPVLSFFPTYDGGKTSGRQIMIGLKQCAGGLTTDGVPVGQCLGAAPAEPATSNASTKFHYTAGGFTGFVASQASGANNLDIDAAGDVDGDGKTDVIYMPDESSVVQYNVAAPHGNATPPQAFGGLQSKQLIDKATGGAITVRRDAQRYLADFNGDGKADLVVRQKDGGYVVCDLKLPGSEQTECHVRNIAPGYLDFYLQGDFNGDGRIDFMVWRSTSWDLHLGDKNTGLTAAQPITNLPPITNPTDEIAAGDFNGDGRTDILIKTPGFKCYPLPTEPCTNVPVLATLDKWQVCFSRPDPMRFECMPQVIAAPGLMGNTIAADFNGDGLADVAFPANYLNPTKTWVICLSAGDGSFARIGQKPELIPDPVTGLQTYAKSLCEPIQSVKADYKNVLLGDFDGDGRTDMARFDDTQGKWEVCLARTRAAVPAYGATVYNNNVVFECQYRTGVDPHGTKNVLTGDFDGDGKTDFFMHHEANFNGVVRADGGVPDLLDLVTNGLGASTSVQYLPLTSGDVYARGSVTAAQDEVVIQSPLYVVRQTNASDGIGGVFWHAYSYSGLKGATNGRGLLGFAEKVVSDMTGMTTMTWFNQSVTEWWQAGRPSVVRTLSNNTFLSDVLHVWQQTTANGITAVNLAQTVEYKKDLDGSTLPCTRVSMFDPYSQTVADVDAFGNSKTVVTETGTCTFWGASFVGDGGKKKATTTYFNDPVEPNWVLGRITQADVEHWKPNSSTSILRRSKFQYQGIAGTNCGGPVTAPYGHLCVELIEPDPMAGDPAGTLFDAKTYQYDARGNITSYGEVWAAGDNVLQNKARSVEYDASGRFPHVMYNERGHKEERDYDVRFGTLIVARKFLTTDTFYSPRWTRTWIRTDDFGRKVGETLKGTNDERLAETDITWAEATSAEATSFGAKYSVTTKTNLGGQSKVYFDSLQREVYSETLGFDASTIAQVQTVYDGKGRKKTITRPAGSTTVTSQLEYDDVGRVTIQTDTNAADAALTTKTFNGYHGLVSVVRRTNPGYPDQKTITTRNSQGHIASVSDCLGTSITEDVTGSCTGGRTAVTTTYVYDPTGNATSITTPPTKGNAAGLTRTATFDRRGRKFTSDDPDLGHADFKFNGLGELVEHRYRQDPQGAEIKVTMAYEQLGRISERNQDGFRSTWYYDYCGVGNLCATLANDTVNHKDTMTENFVDAYGRSYGKRITLSQNNVVISADTTVTLLDAQSRPTQIVYPTLQGVKYAYTGTSQLQSITDLNDNSPYWYANSRYADGQIHVMTLGATTVTKEYDGFGRPKSIKSMLASAIQDAVYSFDAVGNLLTRSDSANSQTPQTFSYDSLNRLVTVNGALIKYDLAGNLDTRDGKTYEYGPASNRVQSVTGSGAGVGTFTYDAVGNAKTAAGAAITWTGFNMPATITKAGASVSWIYDADRQRIQEISSSTGTTTYLGGVERIQAPNGTTRYRHYISSPEGVIGSLETATNESPVRYQWFKDHLGSVVATLNTSSGQKTTFGYDVWGARNPSQLADPVKLQSGFTGHEMLDEVGLIHMNGRIYDPTVGKFLSADPIVQAPFNGQSFNRYSYVMNNPLSATDPTGYSSAWVQWRRPIASIVAAYVLGPFGLLGEGGIAGALGMTGSGAVVASTAAAGFASGGIMGGSAESALQGAFFAIANFGIGASMPADQYLAGNVIAHAAVGCAQQATAGGTCGGGAASGAFSALAGSVLTSKQSFARFATRVAIGAVASRLSGDTAQNGAITAAFDYLFNELISTARGRDAHLTFERFLTSYSDRFDFDVWYARDDTFFLGRPDVIDSSHKMIWEIKPDNPDGYAAGVEQATRQLTTADGYRLGDARGVYLDAGPITQKGLLGQYTFRFATDGLILWNSPMTEYRNSSLWQQFKKSAERTWGQPLTLPGSRPRCTWEVC